MQGRKMTVFAAEWGGQGLHNERIRDLSSSLNAGLLKMIVGVLTICHTQYTWDRSI